MSNKPLRQTVRIAHLVEGILIGIYFYSPLGSEPFYGDLIRFVVLPLIVVSGLVMWQQPRVVRLLRRQRAA
jgi:hypothetical protein